MGTALEVRDLHVSVEGKPILKGVNLVVRQGEVHALMGPNGTGKSTLANTLMGHPSYEVTHGEILFKGKDLVGLAPDERSRLGLFSTRWPSPAFPWPTSCGRP
jgi:Fe-S cluster assembly ATP-binding protein